MIMFVIKAKVCPAGHSALGGHHHQPDRYCFNVRLISFSASLLLLHILFREIRLFGSSFLWETTITQQVVMYFCLFRSQWKNKRCQYRTTTTTIAFMGFCCVPFFTAFKCIPFCLHVRFTQVFFFVFVF